MSQPKPLRRITDEDAYQQAVRDIEDTAEPFIEDGSGAYLVGAPDNCACGHPCHTPLRCGRDGGCECLGLESGTYRCNECGWESDYWLGRCRDCQAWGAMKAIGGTVTSAPKLVGEDGCDLAIGCAPAASPVTDQGAEA